MQASALKLKKPLAWALLGLVLAASACSNESTSSPPPEGERTIPVEVRAATPENLTITSTAVGSIIPWREVSVPSEVEGVVKEVLFEKGDRVRQGQVLLRLDDRELRLALRDAEARLRRSEANFKKMKHLTRTQELKVARRNEELRRAELEEAISRYERARRLFSEKVISRSEYERAEREMKVARAALRMATEERKLAEEGARQEDIEAAAATLEQERAALSLAKKKLADATIRSPIEGYAVEREVEEGELVRRGTVVAELVELGRVKVRADVSESEVVRLRLGAKLRVTVDALPGRSFKGSVSYVGAVADETTRTFPLELSLTNEEGLLRAGMVARVVIPLERLSGVILIPQTALVERGGSQGVFVVKESRAEFRPLRLGRRLDARVQVLSGLNPGERYIIRGIEELQNNQLVEVR